MSVFSGPNIVTDGLKFVADANDKNSYPGTGTSVTDVVTNTSNGTITGATFNSDGYWDFDGTDDVIQFTDMPGNASEHTAEVWVNFDSISGTKNVLFNTNGSGLYPRVMYYNGDITAQYNNGSTRLITGSPLTVGVWYCVAFTYNTLSGGKLYVNGVLKGSNSGTGALSTSQGFNMDVGRDTNLNKFLDGKVANVKIYHKELTSAQLLNSYNSYKSRFGA